ncbi:hypothetical protein B1987_05915 [Mycobacterium kansasii]|uniref:Uncharacterized protein n=1 Tax=Mycobacterium attenuatum TaxID=2341086 RepID=A0A498QAG2_9MYCO|nr:hypothetical protein [Mycobacterium attenuatum]ORB83440.1 hypothetical protein B1987_05915 [Mycobacterium kansasii]VBA41345.1 hypothetical protein LAUMK136_03985 [Mycobacterium attenuatum]VBA60642.1 hypothetical protein LAUMK41_04102 [Mycobacterium attenuatum]
MDDRYTYHVAWSPGHGKYAARCVELPVVSSLATTPQEALDRIVRLVADGDGPTAGPATSAGTKEPLPQEPTPQKLSVNAELAAVSRRSPDRPRVVPRWRTRC